MKTKRLTAKKILLKAAQILRKHGWVRRDFERNGRYCLVGALQEASGARGGPSFPASYYAARGALYDVLGSALSLTSWNDKPARRRSQVIAVLREAARSPIT